MLLYLNCFKDLHVADLHIYCFTLKTLSGSTLTHFMHKSSQFQLSFYQLTFNITPRHQKGYMIELMQNFFGHELEDTLVLA